VVDSTSSDFTAVIYAAKAPDIRAFLLMKRNVKNMCAVYVTHIGFSHEQPAFPAIFS